MNKNFNISGTLLLTVILLLTAACSSDISNDPQSTNGQQEISLNPTVWQMTEGTRATTYDAGTLTSGSFTAAAYNANTITAYISPVQVNYVTSSWVWSDGKHYWPATGNLDFFAYMPAAEALSSEAPYISNISYTADHNVTFTCTNLDMNDATEFVYAVATGPMQNPRHTISQYHRTGLAKLRSTLHGTTGATPLLVIH